MMVSRGQPTLSPKYSCTIIAIVSFGLFLHLLQVFQQQHIGSRHRAKAHPIVIDLEAPRAGSISPEKEYLERLVNGYGLTNETSWLAWRVLHSEQFSEWESAANVPLDFASHHPKVVDVEHPEVNDLRARKRMELPVSTGLVPGAADGSDLLFGISTTYDRVAGQNYARAKSWARFLTNGRGSTNGASLVVMLDRATEEQVEKLDSKLQSYGIDAHVTTTDQAMSKARRYLELARVFKTFVVKLASNGQEKRWFGLIEDDVFFPNLYYLLDRLFAYNTNNALYLGLPSERSDWEMDGDAITTHGGGAVLFTRSVVTDIPRLPCFATEPSDGQPMRGKQWDGLLHECFKKHTTLKMHVIPGFYSPKDSMYAPNFNSYETGAQPLILRDPGERHRMDITKAHRVTSVCGEACFMQRYVFRDNWVLVNGVSLIEYPDGLRHERSLPEPSLGERSDQTVISVPPRMLLDEEGGERTRLTWKGRRRVWTLLDSAAGKDGSVWQAYVKRGDPGSSVEADRIDSVVALIWESEGPRIQ